MTDEFWRWPESIWKSTNIDPRKAKSAVAGLDVGTMSTQAVVMCDGAVFSYANMRTGSNGSNEIATQAMQKALDAGGLKLADVRYTVATGFGRKKVKFAQKAVNEIACHAKGARFMFGPTVRTVVDLGAWTNKVIALTEYGAVADFAVNDKCAAGFGEGIEVFADLMQVPIEEMGERSLAVKEEPNLPVSTTCRIFSNTEAVGLLRGGAKEDVMLATYLYAIAWRLFSLAGRIENKPDLAFTGGMAKNSGIAKRLEKYMKMTALTSSYDPQLAGAIGAALVAGSLAANPAKAAVGV
jgi:predicted CoA-substrate-specific enzyme activase